MCVKNTATCKQFFLLPLSLSECYMSQMFHTSVSSLNSDKILILG